MKFKIWLCFLKPLQICTTVVLIGGSTAVALTVRIDDPSPTAPADIFYTIGSQDPLEFGVQIVNESSENSDRIISWQLALGINRDDGSSGMLLFDAISSPGGSIFSGESVPLSLDELPADALVATDVDTSPEFEGVAIGAGSAVSILTVQLSPSANASGTFTLTMRPWDAEDPDHSSFWLPRADDIQPEAYFNQSTEPQSLWLATIHITNEGDFAGDFNHDLVVDAADYTVWRDGLGADFDPDEYEIWKAHFGESYLGGSIAGGVPEPTSACLGLIAVCMLACSRSRHR